VEQAGRGDAGNSANVQQAAQGTQQVSSNITDGNRGASGPVRLLWRHNRCPATASASKLEVGKFSFGKGGPDKADLQTPRKSTV